ncbi:putative oxidoreductase YcjS [Thalassoglobus neptunius]|uniref:Putative oxidoreductase YcjS n=1 Tax=Thalassoglobus neptunius TaxID=1938619 RepID=A0A5C5V8C3_9PLAN|nr:Gfo/Idh/MocA family oxidoreductase [Thalassoglobus neptunius]TWT34097.1 putative oxidoreductase YcjS [Thalassoglobus neptunius]
MLTRREFVRSGTTAMCVSTAALTSLAHSTSSKSGPFRVAVFGRTGRGNYGHGLDTAWLKIPRTEIVAVCDDDRKGRALAAERLRIEKTYSDYREMFNETRPDIVAVAPRWVDMHHEVVLAAVKAGIHVYVEKPFVRTLVEADEIVDANSARGVRIAVAFPTRYSPLLSTVRGLLNDGAIGEVLELRARGKEDHRGGAEDLWVLGSHLLDLILALGFTPKWCFANVTKDGRPIEKQDIHAGNEGLGRIAGDRVTAIYGLEEGPTASFQSKQDAGVKGSRYALQIFGSRGIIEILEGTMPAVRILQDASWSPGRSGKSWQPVSTAGIGLPEPLTDDRYKDRHTLAIEDLLNAIETSSDPVSNEKTARQSIEMIAGVFESQRRGCAVDFPLQTRVNPLSLY